MRSGNTENIAFTKILRNIVLLLFMIVFVSIAYNFRNKESSTETALMADATSSVSIEGVFIRTEQVISYGGGGIIN